MLNEPIQLTTAIIDLITSIAGFIAIIFLYKVNGDNKLKKKWIHFFISLSIGNLCGFLFHFFVIDEFVLKFLWIGLFAIMFDIAAMFLLIMLYDLKGDSVPTKKQRIAFVAFSLIAYIITNVVTFVYKVDMRPFVIYAIIVVIPAIIIACYLYFKKKRTSMLTLAIIVIPQLFGGYFQLTGTGYFKLIVEFNQDGIYHLCLLLTVIILYFGAKKDIEFKY